MTTNAKEAARPSSNEALLRSISGPVPGERSRVDSLRRGTNRMARMLSNRNIDVLGLRTKAGIAGSSCTISGK